LWERKNKTLQLTEDYEAIIDKNKSIVIVGCQRIPFDTVKELYKLINE
jgi:hypothetical protein